MSLYVTWINTIKEKADETWLTQGQRKAYDAILSKWKSHTFVNLYGNSGVGKSFVARLLTKTHGYYYTHRLEDVPENTAQVVLDGLDYSRELRSIVRERNLGRVILIT
jgi:replication-associated recombination protein RarA